MYIGDQESDVFVAHECGLPAIRLRDEFDEKISNAEWVMPSLLPFPDWFAKWTRD